MIVLAFAIGFVVSGAWVMRGLYRQRIAALTEGRDRAHREIAATRRALDNEAMARETLLQRLAESERQRTAMALEIRHWRLMGVQHSVTARFGPRAVVVLPGPRGN